MRRSMRWIAGFLPAALLAGFAAGPGRAQTLVHAVRGPYLQLGTSTGVVVRWRTDVPTDSRVRYGTSPFFLPLSAGKPALAVDHEVVLSGLSPATRYYYSVGSSAGVLSGGPDHTFVTAPAPGTPQPTRILAFGDAGADNAGQLRVLAAYEAFAAGRRTDVWLVLGDLAYLLGTDPDFQEDIFAVYPGLLRQTVLWPTFGNHEGFSASPDLQQGTYFDVFTLPAAGEAGGVASGTEAWYSFDQANIHFISLNTESLDRSRTGPMLSWLRDDLAANRQAWTIVYFHRPPYSRGSHNSDAQEADGNTAMRDFRERVLPMLEEAGVDLVLTGHSHSYERSYLLDGHYGTSDTFSEGMKLDPGDGSPATGPYLKTDDVSADAHDGTVYAVVGTGGQNLGGALNHPAMVTSVGDLPGVLVIDVAGERLDAVFLDERGGERDRFAIVKGSSNVRPQAMDDRAATVRDTPVSISVLANDRDRNHDDLAVLRASDPDHGTAVVSAGGTVLYTPDPGFVGVDSFLYWVSDGRGGTARARVDVSVTCPPALLFSEDLESAPGPGWTVDTAGNPDPASSTWSVRTDSDAHSPSQSWFSDASALAVLKDDRLVSPAWDLPPNSRLTFWHRFDFEPAFDGGVLEISKDGGTGWTDLGPFLTRNGYNGTLASGGNPIGGRRGWTGTSGPAMVQVEVDLSAFAGPARKIRWRLGCDESTLDLRTGWFVDDIELVQVPAACP